MAGMNHLLNKWLRAPEHPFVLLVFTGRRQTYLCSYAAWDLCEVLLITWQDFEVFAENEVRHLDERGLKPNGCILTRAIYRDRSTLQ